MSSHQTTLHTQYDPKHWSFSRHRRTVMLGLAGLLVLTLVLAIRGVSANHPAQVDSTAAVKAATTSTNDQGVPMNQNDNTADSNASSQSVSSQVSSSTDSSGQTSTNVTVNGRPVAVPPNGELHQTFTDNGGTTRVDISNGSSSNSSSSSVNVQVNSSSTGN